MAFYTATEALANEVDAMEVKAVASVRNNTPEMLREFSDSKRYRETKIGKFLSKNGVIVFQGPVNIA